MAEILGTLWSYVLNVLIGLLGTRITSAIRDWWHRRKCRLSKELFENWKEEKQVEGRIVFLVINGNTHEWGYNGKVVEPPCIGVTIGGRKVKRLEDHSVVTLKSTGDNGLLRPGDELYIESLRGEISVASYKWKGAGLVRQRDGYEAEGEAEKERGSHRFGFGRVIKVGYYMGEEMYLTADKKDIKVYVYLAFIDKKTNTYTSPQVEIPPIKL